MGSAELPFTRVPVSDAASGPAVSVLLCICNAERFLSATISSVIAQSYSDFELIAVDDGSTDGSAKIVESYHDPRIRFIRQKRQGAAGALDNALRRARGEYIALIDQDDLWRPDKLAVHLHTQRSHPGIDLTFSWFRLINDAGMEIGIHSKRYHGTIDFPGLFRDFVIGASSNVVIRKSAIERAGGVDRYLPRLYDLDLCFRVALLAPHNVLAIGRDLMFYRRHSGQISSDLNSLEHEWEQVLLKFKRLAPADFREYADRARSNMDRYFASLAYEQRSYRRARKFLRNGYRHSPTHFFTDRRNWLTLAASVSGALLPARIHRRLERIAGLKR
jgi:glycosyltransferase involved in cell wall biosynthesis